jgi:hypothetical protein
MKPDTEQREKERAFARIRRCNYPDDAYTKSPSEKLIFRESDSLSLSLEIIGNYYASLHHSHFDTLNQARRAEGKRRVINISRSLAVIS